MVVVNFVIGFDFSKVVFFVQLYVFEYQEFLWIFICVILVGEFECMMQYKDKLVQFESVFSGLLMYFVLMVVDILFYKVDIVLVGEDQIQYIELMCEIVCKFNYNFGEMFIEFKVVYNKEVLWIFGVDGQGKMSKSKGNIIGILELFGDIW